jgi:hypothetical protein
MSRDVLLKHAKETKPSYVEIDTSYNVVDFDAVFDKELHQSLYVSVNEWNQSTDFLLKGPQTQDMKNYMHSVLKLFFPFSSDKIATPLISGEIKYQNVDGLNVKSEQSKNGVNIKIWEN